MRKVIPCIVVGLALVGGGADAANTTSTFTVSATIQANCQISNTATLNFNTLGVLSANVDVNTTFDVQCTNTTPYEIGLNEGTGTGASVTTRKLTNGGATINYSLYTTAGRGTVWGNTLSSDTVTGTGNGNTQTFTVYGRIPAQTTPAPNAYSDTITITVTY